MSDWHDTAHQMRADGWTYTEIADAVQVCTSTVWCALNPERSRAHRRKQEHSPARKEYKRNWQQRTKGACEICGAPTWRKALRCVEHRPQAFAAKARRAEIARRWRAGESMIEIADAMGTTVNALGVTIVQMRKRGWDIPYRYNVDSAGKRTAA